MSKSSERLAEYRSAAEEHLGWCDKNGIPVLGGRWDLEDPISGLLLGAVCHRQSARSVLSALCSEPSWASVQVSSAWWPSSLVDLIVNFAADGSEHTLVLEHKHVKTKSNQPGYKRLPDEDIYWQTEAMLREIDRARGNGEESLLGGPFNLEATVHSVLLDARGRGMDEAFELHGWMSPHRHKEWMVVSYADFADKLRKSWEAGCRSGLEPLLAQLFASERQ